MGLNEGGRRSRSVVRAASSVVRVPPALARSRFSAEIRGDEALAAGIVDELAPAEGFEDACLARLGEFVEKDSSAFSRTKAYLRQSSLASMRLGEKDRLGEWIDCWFSESTQTRIRKTVEALQKNP